MGRFVARPGARGFRGHDLTGGEHLLDEEALWADVAQLEGHQLLWPAASAVHASHEEDIPLDEAGRPLDEIIRADRDSRGW